MTTIGYHQAASRGLVVFLENMILFTFWHQPLRPGFVARAYRWTFQVGSTTGLIHQYQDIVGEWRDSPTRVFVVNLTKHFKLGFMHEYYDGPHCSFSLGWLHFQWENWNCKKCLPDPPKPDIEEDFL